ncbi:MAG: hypothetical protein P1U63_02870 [Coxiellaceae bacterium]|nr:hypothetical protein [Coxiellaceae bacterium]
MKWFSQVSNKNINVMLLWVLVATVGRLVPHLPNMTPLLALSLLAGGMLDKKYAMLIALASLILSDGLLSYFFGYPWLGSWSLFTYSGFLLIALAGSNLNLSSKYSKVLLISVFSSFGYWLWTNLGVWWFSYPHSWHGLVSCYVLALPFLRNALVGDVAWAFVLLLALSRLFSTLNQKIIQIR